MADVAVLQAQLELQTAAFTAGVKQVDRRLKAMDGNFKKTNRSIINMEKGLSKLKGGFVGIAASMGAAFSVQTIKNAIAFGDQMIKNAETLGLSAESFQKFSYAADRAGINTSQFTSNMTAFVKRVGEAQAGVGPLVSGLKAMDGALLESIKSAKNQDEAFALVMDAMNNAATATDRARIANAAFSRSGVAMGRMAKDFKELSDEAERMGLVMNESTAQAAVVMQDKLTTLTTMVGVKFKSAVIEATQAVLNFFRVFTDESGVAREIERTERMIARVQDQISAGFDASGFVDPALYTNLSNLQNKLEDLRGELVEFQDTAVETGGDLSSGETAKNFDSFARKVEAVADPFKRFRDEFDLTKEALLAGAITIEQADAYMEHLTKQALELHNAMKPEEVEEYAEAWEGLGVQMQAISDNANLSYESIMANIDSFGEATSNMASNSEMMLGAFTDSFDSFAKGVAQGTAKVKDLFRNMVQSLIAQFLKLMAYKGIMSLLGGPGSELGSMFGNATGLIKNAKGNIFAGGNLVPFAKGGVTNVPTMFAMNNGKTGVMGEAGPEAIMPLKRGPGGELGVNAVQPVVNINNNAPVSVSATARGDGNIDIEIVERAVESAIRRGGNGVAAAIESTYGMNRGSGAFGY